VEIRISRSGGFAGLEEELARVDTDQLDPKQAAMLVGELDDVDFYRLPHELPSSQVGADQFTYSVTVTGDRGSHTVAYQGDGAGAADAGPVGGIVDLVLRPRA
jgi:hypothetical protein